MTLGFASDSRPLGGGPGWGDQPPFIGVLPKDHFGIIAFEKGFLAHSGLEISGRRV